MGSDVILVHRLLKNTVVETTGISAYALFSDALVQVDGHRPGRARHARARARHTTTSARCKLWVHDLERRWQEEDARARVFVTAAKAVSEASVT